MGWSKKLSPELTLDKVKRVFKENRVADASMFLYSVDPKDARIAFNMSCWCSVFEDAQGSREWFARLVAADAVFLDVQTKHHWMSKAMADDPDFAFLVQTIRDSVETKAA